MQSYLEITLVNAACVIPLALAAEAIGRAFKRPALTHTLWVLVLVKLVTPPLWQVPLVDHDLLSNAAQRLVSPIFLDQFVEAASPNDSRPSTFSQQTPADVAAKTALKARPRSLAEKDKFIAIRQSSPIAMAVKWLRRDTSRQLIYSGMFLAWGFGGILWYAVQGFRCVRFRRSLALGCAASAELQVLSSRCAQRLGLRDSPKVWLMPGVMSPMLWGNGNSTLLIFPEQLLDRLGEGATETLLTHELAHFRRRDHWVRVLALMVTGIYWWHPVVWWARREIEASEEECCDAVVLNSSAAPPKRYAEAILDTVDFLAELPSRLPPLATGLSQFPFLRQRLTWIMRGPRKQGFGYWGVAALFVLTTVLPVQPTWLAARSSNPQPQKRAARPILVQLPKSLTADTDQSDSTSTGAMAVMSPSPSTEQPVVPMAWQGYDVRSHSFDKRFVFMSSDASQVLLDILTGRTFDLTPYNITSIAFSPDTYQFATVDSDRFLRLWDAEICDFWSWHIPGGPAKSVDLSVGGRWIVTSGQDGVVRIWNVASQTPIRELPREAAPVNCVRFSSSGELLAIASGDATQPHSGRIALFNVGTWNERISMNWNSPAAAVSFSSDDESLISGDWQGRIARWSTRSGELLGLLEGQRDLIAIAEFSPNGSPLVEIEIPDLDPNTNWGEPTSGEQLRWFFDRWPLTSPAGSATPANPAATKKPAAGS